MSLNRPPPRRSLAVILGAVLFFPSLASAVCGPFTDVVNLTYCPFISEIYNLGITLGTSATTYDPNANVPREQMAAFIARDFDRTAARTSRRGALNQWWTTTPHYDQGLGRSDTGFFPSLVASDGTDVWIASADGIGGKVSRVHGSTGEVLAPAEGAAYAYGVVVAMGRVFVTGRTSPGHLYMVDPSTLYGATHAVSVADLGDNSTGIAFDGNRIWTANAGSISIVTPSSAVSWAVLPVTTGINSPIGLVFDGHNMWATDAATSLLLKMDSNGVILQSVGVGLGAAFPIFDGNNIWVPNALANSLTVVRVSDGAVVKTFSAANGNQNGMNAPFVAAFDGQNVLVTNYNGGLSLFKAADLTPIAFIATPGAAPFGVCNDGINFWVTFNGTATVGRF